MRTRRHTTDQAALRTQAEQARQHAQCTRAEAEQVLADAEQQARAMTDDAQQAEKDADAMGKRAAAIDHASALHRLVVDADQRAADLAGEYAVLTAWAEALDARLAELGVRREDATIAVGAAKEAGDPDAVAREWTTMSAIDEVVATLTAQLAEVRERATTVGYPGSGGDYDDAAGVGVALRQELDDTLNGLDPTRAERLAVALTLDYARTLTEAGVPGEEALRSAAFLVAVKQHPEAAAAMTGAVDGSQPSHRVVVAR
jgi:hypothetical protein